MEGGARMVGGWWEGDRRIVGGMVVAVGLLSSCHGDLRDRLLLPQRNQVSFRVARGLSGFLSRRSRGINPHLELRRGITGLFLSCDVKLGVPLECGRVSQGPS